MDFITINKKMLARNKKAFEKGGCVGYFRVYKDFIALMDSNRNRVGVINKEGVIGAATRTKQGRYWYSYADVSLIGKFESYSEKVTQCKALVNSLLLGDTKSV